MNENMENTSVVETENNTQVEEEKTSYSRDEVMALLQQESFFCFKEAGGKI